MNLIRQIPTGIHYAYEQVTIIGKSAKERIYQIAANQADSWSQTDLWKKQGKPFYERNIQPLNKTDLILFGISLVISALVTAIALRTWGIASLPIAMGGGTLLLMGSVSLSSHRVKMHWNKQAVDHIEHIHQLALTIMNTNQQFAQIQEQRSSLDKLEFEHLKEDLKILDEEITKFRTVVLNDHFCEEKVTTDALLESLKPLTENDLETELLKNLKTELNKVGKNDQNLAVLELYKQKLRSFNPYALEIAADLFQKIDRFIRASKGARIEDAREAFVAYLTGLKEKLS